MKHGQLIVFVLSGPGYLVRLCARQTNIMSKPQPLLFCFVGVVHRQKSHEGSFLYSVRPRHYGLWPNWDPGFVVSSTRIALLVWTPFDILHIFTVWTLPVFAICYFDVSREIFGRRGHQICESQGLVALWSTKYEFCLISVSGIFVSEDRTAFERNDGLFCFGEPESTNRCPIQSDCWFCRDYKRGFVDASVEPTTYQSSKILHTCVFNLDVSHLHLGGSSNRW